MVIFSRYANKNDHYFYIFITCMYSDLIFNVICIEFLIKYLLFKLCEIDFLKIYYLILLISDIYFILVFYFSIKIQNHIWQE